MNTQTFDRGTSDLPARDARPVAPRPPQHRPDPDADLRTHRQPDHRQLPGDNNQRNPQDGDSGGITTLLKRAVSLDLLKETFKEWSEDDASQIAASLAYYTATALAQLLIGILAIAGFIYSTEAAQEQLVTQANRFMGAQAGEIVQTIVQNADQPELARVAGLISLALLLWSASNIFVQLQKALDTVWGVELRKDLPLMDKIKRRLFPLVVVAGIGVLVVVAIFAGTALSALAGTVTDVLPGGAIIWQILNYVLTLAIFTGLFALIFKVLPDVKIRWGDVWPGAALTALLFVVGQIFLTWYLGRQSSASVYGAAGSLIVFLLWIYYSAQIFLLGAEYTQVYATRYGKGVLPDEDAVPRGSQERVKPAAQVMSTNRSAAQWSPSRSARANGGNGTVSRREVASMARAWHAATNTRNDLWALGGVTSSLLRDFTNLIQLEVRLARAEVRETIRRVWRGAALAVGGGMLLYGAVLALVATVVLVLTLFMPVWVSALLIGLLLVVEGWILTIAAQHKLRELAETPKQSAASIREDVDTIKSHLSQ